MKIHPSLLEFGDWPCLHTDKVNHEPGVYVILAKVGSDSLRYETLYIGCSKNLRRRLNNHEVVKRYSGSTFSIRIHFLYTKQYRDYEIALIERYNPLVNILHNG